MNEQAKRILIVDDEPGIRTTLSVLIREETGFLVETADGYYQAIEKLRHPFDLVISDLTMPDKSGIDLLKEMRRTGLSVPFILMTAYSTVGSAVEVMKEGAFDYVVKPFDNDKMIDMVFSATRHPRDHSDQGEKMEARFADLLGKSQAMNQVFYHVQKAAQTDSTVLITGESGTGKELVARAIHYTGVRKSKPFVPLNCAAVPEHLLESELFGHERGAFSGAIRSREGKFELAQKGTLFLDEIGEMDPSLQVKLLRLIQEKSFERVGGQKTFHVDVRLIAATNRNIEKAIASGQFREDLFYRLNVIHIQLPPLRERREDLDILCEHFLSKKSRKLGIPTRALSKAAKEFIHQYSFPGNVRELENMLEQACIMSRNEILQKEDLVFRPSTQSVSSQDVAIPIEKGFHKIRVLQESLEKQLLEKALSTYPEKSNEELAHITGTTRRVFEKRLKDYGIDKS
ncbi:MAG: sigma-54 dependent transcriptional regulator [Bdellovibrionota bacterium]